MERETGSGIIRDTGAGLGGNEMPLEPIKIKVKSGDTLTGIAKTYGVSLDALLRTNPDIVNPNEIWVGQKVSITIDRQAQGGVYDGWDLPNQITGMSLADHVLGGGPNKTGSNPYSRE